MDTNERLIKTVVALAWGDPDHALDFARRVEVLDPEWAARVRTEVAFAISARTRGFAETMDTELEREREDEAA